MSGMGGLAYLTKQSKFLKKIKIKKNYIFYFFL